MKKVLLLVFMFTLLVYSQPKNFQPDRKDLGSMKLKGNVVRVSTSTYEAGGSEKSVYQGKWKRSESFLFNKNGTLDYDADMNYRYKYHYDDKNNLIKIENYEAPYKDYVLDANYNMISSKSKAENLNYTLEGDKLKLNGSKNYFIFDANGKVIEYSEYNRVYKNKYDEKGNLIEQKMWDEKGSPYSVNYLKYNEHSDLIYFAYHNASYSKKFEQAFKAYEIKYLYKYDKKGNWTEKTTLMTDPLKEYKPFEIEIRTIKYDGDKPIAASKSKSKSKNVKAVKGKTPEKGLVLKIDLPIDLKTKYEAVEKAFGKPIKYFPMQRQEALNYRGLFSNGLSVEFNENNEVEKIAAWYGDNIYFKDAFFALKLSESADALKSFGEPASVEDYGGSSKYLIYNVNGNTLKVEVATKISTWNNGMSLKPNTIREIDYEMKKIN